jgi:hypothetical protein
MLKNKTIAENNFVRYKSYYEEHSTWIIIFALIEYNAPRFKTRKYIV